MKTQVFAFVLALAGMALPNSASAQEMTVATFVTKAEALQAMGPAAMFSDDVAALKAEVARAAAAYRAHVETGRPPRSCPPPKGSTQITSDQLLAHFRSIPQSKRKTTTVRAAFFNYATGRFPCR